MSGVLLLDRGNHSLKAALSVSGHIRRRWRIEEASAGHGPECGPFEPIPAGILEQIMSAGPPSSAAVSSVVPGWTAKIGEYLAGCGIRDVVIAGSGARLPFSLLVDEPDRLGADRISAACGAVASGIAGAVIVDAGTAVTVDVLTSKGFEGGSIFPGIGLLSSSLSHGTAALPRVEISGEPGLPPCRSTEKAVEAGVFWGLVGAVNELVLRSMERSAAGLPVLLTGGSAPAISRHLKVDFTGVPDLVLLGLQLLHSINSAEG